MVIYLKHEKHGTKVAIAEEEAQEDEKHGWVRYTLGGKQEDQAVEAEDKPVNALRTKRSQVKE